MPSSPWRIEIHLARLETEQLCAEIDLLMPAGGVKVLSACGGAVADATLFKAEIPSVSQSQMANVEFFVRGDDLIAIYPERTGSPFRSQIYWRFIRSVRSFDQRGEEPAATVELIVSMQTGLLDSKPTLEVTSELPAAGVAQLTSIAPAYFLDCRASGFKAPLGPQTGLGCFQFPLVGGRLVYVEMIHPADFRQAVVSRSGRDAAGLRLIHTLFPERLEKGVILRSRLRGLFAPAECRSTTVPQAFEEFAHSEPPLTV